MDLTEQVAKESGKTIEAMIEFAKPALDMTQDSGRLLYTVAEMISNLDKMFSDKEGRPGAEDLFKRYNGKLDCIQLPDDLVENFKILANKNGVEYQILDKDQNTISNKILFKAKDRKKVNEILKEIQKTRERNQGKSFRREMKEYDKQAKEKQAEKEDRAKIKNQDISR